MLATESIGPKRRQGCLCRHSSYSYDTRVHHRIDFSRVKTGNTRGQNDCGHGVNDLLLSCSLRRDEISANLGALQKGAVIHSDRS